MNLELRIRPVWASPSRIICNACILGLFAAGQVFAQTTTGTTTPTTTQPQVNLNQILQALGGLNGLGGLIGQTTGGTTTGGTTTGGTTTGGTTTGGTTTGGTTGGQAQVPFIIQDQFTTTKGASLSARSPGLWVKQAMGMQDGSVTVSAAQATEPFNGNFFKDTGEKITLAIIQYFQTLLTTANAAIGASTGLTGSTGTTTTTGTSTSGSATSGAGTTTTVP